MKPLATALGVAAILLLSSAANAQVDYEWDGDSVVSSDWDVAANWNPTACPGSAAGDTALINYDSSWNPEMIEVDSAIGNAVDWVRVDAWTALTDLELRVVSGGSLSVTHTTPSYILLWAGATFDAKLSTLDSGTDPVLEVNNIECRGGIHDPEEEESYGDQGLAIVDIDADSTFQVNHDVNVYGEVDFGGSDSFNVYGDVRLSNDATEMHKTGTGTVTVYGRIVMSPGPGSTGTTLTTVAGTITTNY